MNYRTFYFNRVTSTDKYIKLFLKNEVVNDESKNQLNQNILDSILDDDDETFLEYVSQTVNEESNPNQRFTMTNYKLPGILSSRPTYASLCAFFGSEKCFTALSMLCPNGISSEMFKKKDDNKRSPIHFACLGGSLKIIRELFQAGFDLNEKDAEGMKPSHYSAMSGTTDVMKYLWTKGANILEKDMNILTPFQVACWYGNIDIIKFICEKVDTKGDILNDNYQFLWHHPITPLHLACEGGHVEVVNYILSKKEIAKKQIKALDTESRTPLLVACQNGSLECVKSLVKFGGSKLSCSGKKHVALIDASAGGYVDIVKFLLCQKEVNINDVNSKKLTALEAAVLNCHLKVIEILIQNGAAKNKSEAEIGDLFLAACGTLNLDIVKYLDSCLSIPYSTMGDVFMRQACKIESEELVTFLLNKKCSLKGIDVSDVNFRVKWTPFMTFLKDKGADFSQMKSKKGDPMIIRSIKTASLDSIKQLVSEGVELNKEIIEEHQLVENACSQGKFDLFSFLITFQPEVKNPTACLNKLLNKLTYYKNLNRNSKRFKESIQIIEVFLRDYHADPNDESNLEIAISYCFTSILDLFFKYGAKYEKCHIDFDIFENKSYWELFTYLKEKNFDFNELKCINGNPLIIETVRSGNGQIFNCLIARGTTINSQMIDEYNLLECVVKKTNFFLFIELLKYLPTINDATRYLKLLYLNLNRSYFLMIPDALKISEVLLRDFHANPSDESVIDFATSNAFTDVLEQLIQYGADFNSCGLDYSKMITADHIPVFNLLEKNGCQFQKVKKEDFTQNDLNPRLSFRYYLNQLNVNQDDPPIYFNLRSTIKYSYNIGTFLFLLKYSKNEDIINFVSKSKSSIFSQHNQKERNVIDILLSIRGFIGIYHVYKKLNMVILPNITPANEFLILIINFQNQELTDMVTSYIEANTKKD